MALLTLGTTSTSALGALVMTGAMVPADLALLQLQIKNDLVNGNPVWPGAFSQDGLLFIPNRGVLKVLPGDYVGVDATGWPILVSANAIASGSTEWAHS